MRSSHPLRLVALVVLLVGLGACARGCTSRRPPIHPVPNMDDQPRYEAQAASTFFADGAAMQPPVEGTVARGELEYLENDALYTGRLGTGGAVAGSADGAADSEAADGFVTEIPLPVTDRLLARGEERYGIYCTPCHGARADGRGVLRERSGVQTANLLEDRFRAYPVGRIYDVITNGFGLMPGYKYPVPPEDRWAITAWVRKLQEAEGPMPPPSQAAASGSQSAARSTAVQSTAAQEPEGEPAS